MGNPDNSNHAELELPATPWELLDALDKLRLSEGQEPYWQVEDMGRGCPVDWNEKEGRYNWELVFCELYAGGKYDNENSENYEFSLGLNGLGSCATQYASQYMDVTVWRGGKEYTLHFEKGENIGGAWVAAANLAKHNSTGTYFIHVYAGNKLVAHTTVTVKSLPNG